MKLGFLILSIPNSVRVVNEKERERRAPKAREIEAPRGRSRRRRRRGPEPQARGSRRRGAWGGAVPSPEKFLILALNMVSFGVGGIHSSSERSERFVRFEPNVRSERVRYFSERETNVQALKRLNGLINLIAVK